MLRGGLTALLLTAWLDLGERKKRKREGQEKVRRKKEKRK